MMLTRVLLADDHALVRSGLRTALANIPGLVIIGEVENGDELRAALLHLTPDLLMVDANMPDFNPADEIRRIKLEHPFLKILVVSAYDHDNYVTGMLGAGADGYHLKDQPLNDLRLAVQRVLAGERWISSPLINKLIQPHAPAHNQPGSSLSRHQREMLQMLGRGYKNRKIAWQMNLSIKTIENQLTALYRAIGVENRAEAVNYAFSHPELLAVDGSAPTRQENRLEQNLVVLVVDDNPLYRQELSRMISTLRPLNLFEAEDTEEALTLVEKINPHLALIDVVLQDEDGIQCAQKIKALSPATRLVLISAYPDREFRRLGLEAGAVAFLDKKDMDAASLKRLIDDAFSGAYFSEPPKDF